MSFGRRFYWQEGTSHADDKGNIPGGFGDGNSLQAGGIGGRAEWLGVDRQGRSSSGEGQEDNPALVRDLHLILRVMVRH